MATLQMILDELQAKLEADPAFTTVREVDIVNGFLMGAYPKISIHCIEVRYSTFDGDDDRANASVAITLGDKAPNADPVLGYRMMLAWVETIRTFLLKNQLMAQTLTGTVPTTKALINGSDLAGYTVDTSDDVGQVDWIQLATVVWNIEWFQHRNPDATEPPVTHRIIEVDDEVTTRVDVVVG